MMMTGTYTASQSLNNGELLVVLSVDQNRDRPQPMHRATHPYVTVGEVGVGTMQINVKGESRLWHIAEAKSEVEKDV